MEFDFEHVPPLPSFTTGVTDSPFPCPSTETKVCAGGEEEAILYPDNILWL